MRSEEASTSRFFKEWPALLTGSAPPLETVVHKVWTILLFNALSLSTEPIIFSKETISPPLLEQEWTSLIRFNAIISDENMDCGPGSTARGKLEKLDWDCDWLVLKTLLLLLLLLLCSSLTSGRERSQSQI
jgi:hypothetical protein